MVSNQVRPCKSCEATDLSCNKDEFDKAKDDYELAFKENGHNAIFKYEPAKQNSKRKRNRQRNILWFNPPYNLQVKTNIKSPL